MLIAQKWVVCEQSDRWASALRSTFARSPKSQSTPRLYEERTIVDLLTHLDELGPDLALIEVGHKNLTEVLQLLVRRGQRLTQFVALLQDAPDQTNPPAVTTGDSAAQPLADLLWELGVLEVVESPRQLRGLMALQDRLAAARGTSINSVAERHSFADWARSTLPWQDT